MSIIATEPKKHFPLAAEGLHPAVCCDVVDLGLKDTQWGSKQKVQLRWQTSARDDSGRRFMIVKRYTLTLHEKSELRRAIEGWQGKKLTEAELGGFDVESLLDQTCQLVVTHTKGSDGRTYALVQAIVPPSNGARNLAVEDYTRVIDREPDSA